MLDRLVAAGVQNVLALRGDPPKGQTAFTPVEGGFQYASELVRFIRDLHDSTLCLGGACYPEKHPECGNPAVDLANLKRKVDEGLDFVITQLFFDNRRYFEFVERARQIGIKVPILAGIMPITNAAQVERFTVSCGAALPFELAAELDRRRNDAQAVLELGVAHATGSMHRPAAERRGGHSLLYAQPQRRHAGDLHCLCKPAVTLSLIPPAFRDILPISRIHRGRSGQDAGAP